MGVILLYHRVGSAASDPWALNVTPDRFHEHMARIRRDFRAVSLRRLVEGASSIDPLVAVTFDDGYAETAEIARTALNRFEVPATIFVPSGAIDSAGEFWWDELERLLLGAGELPEDLALDVLPQPFEWRLGAARSLSLAEVREAREWCAWQEPAPTPRHALYVALWRLCHSLQPEPRSLVLHQLRDWAGDDGTARSSHQTLSARGLAALSRSELVEIGGHTVTHPALSTLSSSAQADEVLADRLALQRMTGQPVESFAYPFGKASDYTTATVEIVRAAGYRSACSNVRGRVWDETTPFELPRLFVADWESEALAAQVTDLLAEAHAGR